jgi:nitrite reductase/ring-hydroxylating ferredoxin subunit
MPDREWQVGRLEEISEPGAVEFKAGEDDWPFRCVVVRWQSQVYAYANSCAHLGHPLNLQPDQFFHADGALLICSSHGALFEPDTGLCVSGPCVGASLRSLPCRVENGDVVVTAPDSQRG